MNQNFKALIWLQKLPKVGWKLHLLLNHWMVVFEQFHIYFYSIHFYWKGRFPTRQCIIVIYKFSHYYKMKPFWGQIWIENKLRFQHILHFCVKGILKIEGFPQVDTANALSSLGNFNFKFDLRSFDISIRGQLGANHGLGSWNSGDSTVHSAKGTLP